MRNYATYALFCLFCFQCKKAETIAILAIPCDCKDLPIQANYIFSGKGIIRFPNTPKESYGIGLLPLTDSPNYTTICTDSTFIRLIKIKKITDSTTVSFRGGVVDGKTNCRTSPSLRIFSLEKAP